MYSCCLSRTSSTHPSLATSSCILVVCLVHQVLTHPSPRPHVFLLFVSYIKYSPIPRHVLMYSCCLSRTSSTHPSLATSPCILVVCLVHQVLTHPSPRPHVFLLFVSYIKYSPIPRHVLMYSCCLSRTPNTHTSLATSPCILVVCLVHQVLTHPSPRPHVFLLFVSYTKYSPIPRHVLMYSCCLYRTPSTHPSLARSHCILVVCIVHQVLTHPSPGPIVFLLFVSYTKYSPIPRQVPLYSCCLSRTPSTHPSLARSHKHN